MTTTSVIDSLHEATAGLLAQASAKGADETQVAGTHTVKSRIGFEKNDFNIAAHNIQTSYGLTVHKQQKKGSASTNEPSAECIAQTVDSALTLAEYSVEDQYLCLPEPRPYTELPGRYDLQLAELPIADLRELAHEFIEVGRAEPRLSLDNAGIEVVTSYYTITNSKGLRATDQHTEVHWHMMGMGKSPEELTSFDYISGHSYDWASTREKAFAAARTFVDKLMSCFGARSGESYKGKVLLSPAALGSVLLSPIEFHISGRQIMDGKSRWDEALGEAVAGGGFTLIDDPADLEITGATPFDSEGVPVARSTIIDNGILRMHTDSCYTANRRGTQSTGHAGGLHSIHILPGDKNVQELIDAGERLVVVERFSGNVDNITGDFSGVAKGSHYYQHGQHQCPLKETMIAGNFFELLKNVGGISDEAIPYGNVYSAPYVLVDGVSVTAG